MVSRRGLFPTLAPSESTGSFLSLSSVHLSVTEGQVSQWPGGYTGPSERPEPLTYPSLEGLCLDSLQENHAPFLVPWTGGRYGLHQEGSLANNCPYLPATLSSLS